MARESDHILEPAEPPFTEPVGDQRKRDVNLLVELATLLALRKFMIIKVPQPLCSHFLPW